MNPEILNIPLSEIDMSVRAMDAFKQLNCLTIGDVIKHNPNDFLRLQNCGRRTVYEIRLLLWNYNLGFYSNEREFLQEWGYLIPMLWQHS